MVSPFSSQLAHALRFLAIDAVEAARSGHPGLPMGAADIACVVFMKSLCFDALSPSWPDRDRFVLSAGHGSMLLYAALHLLGYPDMTSDDLKKFRQLGAKTAGHPEYGHALGIETTTGPLGQGLANAVGMALAERHLAARFGDDLVDHYTYALVGDGCLMEGLSQEALTLAGHLQLRKLIVLFDDNGISIDGPTSLTDSTDHLARFKASGWSVSSVDGHNQEEIFSALCEAKKANQPSFIACKTTIGYGSPTKQGTSSVHGSPLGAEEIARVRQALGWEHGPFEIPEDIRAAWLMAGRRGAEKRHDWEARLAAKPEQERQAFQEAFSGNFSKDFQEAMASLRRSFVAAPKAMATRIASQEVLEVVNASSSVTIGGSADLTGSNNTRSQGFSSIKKDDFSGRYIHWGIREHAMAAAMNGMALHGGVVPYGGTFLVFSDYCRPALRLSALMGQRVIYVMTHDSIGLGEDGPTHQPVEHLASLRAIPGLFVFRPCDRVEVAQCWDIALNMKTAPSLLALSRQTLPQIVGVSTQDVTGVWRGAYRLEDENTPKTETTCVLFASGSELEIALLAQRLLTEVGIASRVVSVPCFELFWAQPESYRASVLGKETIRVAIEAGVRMGWDSFIGSDGLFIGMEGFGASGPYQEVYEHFGLTPKAVLDQVLARKEQNR